MSTLTVIDVLGYVGAASISCCMMPQTYKVCKTRSAKDISTRTLSLQIVGNACFFVFGALSDPPVPQVCACSGTVLLCVAIIAGTKAALGSSACRDADATLSFSSVAGTGVA